MSLLCHPQGRFDHPCRQAREWTPEVPATRGHPGSVWPTWNPNPALRPESGRLAMQPGRQGALGGRWGTPVCSVPVVCGHRGQWP